MHCVSRSGLVHGQTPFKHVDDGNGRKRALDPLKQQQRRDDVWCDFERVLLDHVGEVLTKLGDGSLDDEIWGKIAVMERGRRIAKAYLRKTTIIVDGGDEGFDGRTLGFNHFKSNENRDASADFRSKINDGVIVKMDAQGNLKAMARGLTPIFVQGCRDPKSNCASDKLIRVHGRLTTRVSTETNDEDRVFKIFEMKKFKQALEKETCDTEAKQKNLFLRTCVRIALVKDGGGPDPNKTPCWFLIVNIVALEMARELILTLNMKVPSFPTVIPQQFMNQSQFASLLPQATYSSQNLTQLLVAAAMHQQQQSASQIPQILASNFGVSPFSAATSLANSLAINQQKPKTTIGGSKSSGYRRNSRRRPHSSSDDTEDEEAEMDRFSDDVNTIAPSFGQSRTTLSSSSFSSSSANENLEQKSYKKAPSARKIADNLPKKSQRPRLNQLIEQYNIQQQRQKHQLQTDIDYKESTTTASATSGYDSPRDLFDSSGSWSSGNTSVLDSKDSPEMGDLQTATNELSLDSHFDEVMSSNSHNESMPDYSIYNYNWKTIASTPNIHKFNRQESNSSNGISMLNASACASVNNKSESYTNKGFVVQPKQSMSLACSAKNVKQITAKRNVLKLFHRWLSTTDPVDAQTVNMTQLPSQLKHTTLKISTTDSREDGKVVENTNCWKTTDAMTTATLSRSNSTDSGNFEQLMLESNRQRGESLPPPPLPQHSSRAEGRMLTTDQYQQNNVNRSRPSARPRQRQLAPKYVNASDSRLQQLSSGPKSTNQNLNNWQSSPQKQYGRSSSAIPKHTNQSIQQTHQNQQTQQSQQNQRARSPSASRGLRHILQRFNNSPKHQIHSDFEEPAFSWRRQF